MPLKRLEQLSLWFLLFVISSCTVFIFTNNAVGAMASGATTASLKAPIVLYHQHLWAIVYDKQEKT